MVEGEKEKEKNFTIKNSASCFIYFYYKPTLNKTLFFLPFFFVFEEVEEDESSAAESSPSSPLPAPQALPNFGPVVVLRIFKII
jgi:hypothetical protein